LGHCRGKGREGNPVNDLGVGLEVSTSFLTKKITPFSPHSSTKKKIPSNQ
jgi:hypothetical protein